MAIDENVDEHVQEGAVKPRNLSIPTVLQKKKEKNMRRHIYHLENGVSTVSEAEAETHRTKRKLRKRKKKTTEYQEYQWITFS